MFNLSGRKNKNLPAPKNLTQAIVQESSRHIRLKKWTDGVKTFAIALVAIVSVGITLSDTASESIGPHIAIVPLNGAIETGSKETDGWKVSRVIAEAMEDNNVKAVVIEANSPGGSPADAEHIYKTILSYRTGEEVSKPIYMAVRSVCASACYYIAAAVDEVYAANSSLIGSIGVRMDGWDFQEVMGKVGVKRRVFHAGEHKALLDPFKDVSSEERAFVQDKLLTKLHQQFITAVKNGRGGRLVDDPNLFTGLIWTGEEALQLGLIDGIKTPTEMENYIEQRHGVEKYIYHGRQKFKLSNLFSMDSEDFMDMLASSIYHEFKSDVKNMSEMTNFK